MPSDHDADLHRRRDALTGALYDAMLEPARYDDLLQAWDAYFVDPGIVEDRETFPTVVKHFETAGHAFEAAQIARATDDASRLGAMSCPAALVSAEGCVVTANASAQDVLGLDPGADVFGLDFEAQAERALRRSLRTGIEPTVSLLRCFPESADRPEFLLVDPAHDFGDTAVLLLRSVRKVWSPDLDQMLAEAFLLTPAERELFAALFAGETVGAYAERTGRRKTTVRSQLGALLSKSGARGQTDLLRMATSVAGLLGERAMVPQVLRSGRTGRQISQVHALSRGVTVETVTSGAPHGRPLLFCQTSTTPVLPRGVVDALARGNIRLISLVKSGSGRTTRMPAAFGQQDWARLWLELADRLGLERFAVGGQCSGGPYALALAAAAGARCSGCLLVDAGAPLRTVAMIDAMAPNPRRHHRASRFCPGLTVPAISYVAADMKRSPEGTARAVRYFYTDSPTDEAAVAADPEMWRITVANLAYSFENIPQLVRDVAVWSNDTSAQFEAAEAVCGITFFQGEDNFMMRADALRAFCAEDPERRRADIEPGVGQLALWARPEAFVRSAMRTLPPG